MGVDISVSQNKDIPSHYMSFSNSPQQKTDVFFWVCTPAKKTDVFLGIVPHLETMTDRISSSQTTLSGVFTPDLVTFGAAVAACEAVHR